MRAEEDKLFGTSNEIANPPLVEGTNPPEGGSENVSIEVHSSLENMGFSNVIESIISVISDMF